MEIDRRAFIASLGGAAAVAAMDHETRAEALEHHLSDLIDGDAQAVQQPAGQTYPTVAELEAAIETRNTRRGVGSLFTARETVKRLPAMPDKPTLVDFYQLRFAPASHVLQSATRALKTGQPEPIILACLLHDVVQNLIKVDHGWWGAQLVEPYVPAETTFAIRYHQALRFYADTETGYEYPEMYYRTFGIDYVPPPYIEAAYKYALKHKNYIAARMVTVNDLYAFDRNAKVTLDPFIDIIGRHFKQPKEGLGNDNSPVAHMWRTLRFPDQPL